MEEEIFQDTLSSLEDAIEDKAENMAKLIRCLDADAKAIKDEEQRLAERRRTIENRISSVKEYLQNQMEVAGLDKVKRPTVTVSIQNNPPSVNIVDESLIPSTYMIAQAPKIDKKGILTALKNGEEIYGAEMVQGRSVRIK
jgi:transcriptional regulator of heat shock response